MHSERPIRHIVPAEPWGGIQALVPVLAQEQARQGLAVELICLGPGQRIRRLAEQCGLDAVTRSLAGPRAPLALLASLRARPEAIVHTHCEPIWASAAIVLSGARRWVEHAHVYPADTPTWKTLVSRGLQRRFARRHIAISHSIGRALLASGMARAATLDVVHNGVAIPTGAMAPPRGAAAPFTIAFIGRIVAEKGIFDFLDLVRLLGRDANWRFVVYGDGADLATARERATGLPVVFHGHVEDIAAAWETVDVAAVFSHREPFGLVFLEAALLGAATVSYANDSGGSEVAATLRSAHQVAPGDLPAAVAVLRTLAADRAATALAMTQDRATIAARYDIATMARGVAAAYARLDAL